MPKKGLQWTAEQTEIANRLRSGASPQAVMAENHKKSLVYKVKKAIKDELKELRNNPQTTRKPESAVEQPPAPQTRILPRVTSEVSVGEILIQPEDWRVNQTGGLLILGCYEHAKVTYGYAGTVGEFLCDCVQIVRKFMGLDMVGTDDYLWKEDNNGRRDKHETGQGADLLAEVREGSGGGEGEP